MLNLTAVSSYHARVSSAEGNPYADFNNISDAFKLSLSGVTYFNPLNPDYENKKGTIIGYDESPLVYRLKQVVEMLMQDNNLIVEGNKYVNVKKKTIHT